MPARRHSKESIVSTLQSLATNLGTTTFTKKDVQRVLPTSSIRAYFGTLRNAIEAAGLNSTDNIEHLNSVRPVLSDDELFSSIRVIEGELGREPKAD